MIKADPEPDGTASPGWAVGVGNVLFPFTSKEVMEWISWILAALISIRVPGAN